MDVFLLFIIIALVLAAYVNDFPIFWMLILAWVLHSIFW